MGRVVLKRREGFGDSRCQDRTRFRGQGTALEPGGSSQSALCLMRARSTRAISARWPWYWEGMGLSSGAR